MNDQAVAANLAIAGLVEITNAVFAANLALQPALLNVPAEVVYAGRIGSSGAFRVGLGMDETRRRSVAGPARSRRRTPRRGVMARAVAGVEESPAMAVRRDPAHKVAESRLQHAGAFV